MGSKFYAVRKGRSVGIYNNWDDCKSQVHGYPGCQYKSFSSLKEAEDYLAQNVPPPHPACKAQKVDEYLANQNKSFSLLKRAEGFPVQEAQGPETSSNRQGLYRLEFDGASKGNPGKAGAGAVLRYPDGSVAYTLKEGVGVATNNVAEYRALIRGLKVCLDKGIDRIHVRGDSNLVCMQVQDIWKTRNENIVELSKEAKELKAKFREFHIEHVLREFNSEADALANAAIYLSDGEWTSS